MQQLPAPTAERRPAWFQRAVRWIAWLGFLALVVRNSGSSSFGGWELLALAAALAVTVWSLAQPLGGPKLELTRPEHLLGELARRPRWAALLVGTLLTVGGIAAGVAIIHDLATGIASAGDVLHDMAVFAEGWTVELFTNGGIDAHLEDTHGYLLSLLLVPGVILLVVGAASLRGGVRGFRAEPDGGVSVLEEGSWQPVAERGYAVVHADGSTVRFEKDDGPPLVLAQSGLVAREHGVGVAPDVVGSFFKERLRRCDFEVEERGRWSFTARR